MISFGLPYVTRSIYIYILVSWIFVSISSKFGHAPKKIIYEIILEDTKDVVFSIIDAKTQPLLPHFCNSCSFLIVGGALFAWTTSENY